MYAKDQNGFGMEPPNFTRDISIHGDDLSVMSALTGGSGQSGHSNGSLISWGAIQTRNYTIESTPNFLKEGLRRGEQNQRSGQSH